MDKSSKLWVSDAEAVLYITLVLFIVGTVNIFSASFVHAQQVLHDSYYFLKRQLIMFIIGFAALLCFSKLDYHRLRRWLTPLVLVTFGLLAAVHFVGVEVNGARRWLNVGFQFQPSELAKLAVIIVVSLQLGPLLDRQRKITLWSKPFVIAILFGGLVLKQPDMGTAVMIVGICLALYLVAGLPKEQIVLLFGGGVAVLAYAAMAASYRAERIAAWLNPWAYQQGIGYQTVQGLLAIGSGGFFGTGLGMGASKFHYLPEAHTDFAFAVLCQEMGFLGAVLVLFLIAMLGFYGIRISLKAPDCSGKLLALGTVILVAGQAVINIAMVSGILPVVGVPLPFVSFGGTSLIVNLISIGILINIGRQTAAVRTGQPETEPVGAGARLKLARKARMLNRIK
jgi:cell division protein FtsW